MRLGHISFLLASLLTAAACQPEAHDVEVQSQETTQSIVEGSPEGIGVLRFLNDATTTETLLDDDVPLPSHAAANLVAHRDGPDGVFGTADDDLYDDLAEVLSVPQIGPSRLATIAAYAEANGFVPTEGDVIGTFDDVPFTAEEAAATLALANTASETTLDVDLALDSRAVGSILDARPIGTLLELSELYYVGKSALTKLKEAADTGGGSTGGGSTGGGTTLGAVGDDCTANDTCEAGLNCIGIPYDGSPAVGRCADLSNVPGANDECGYHFGGCDEGLSCSGTSIYGGEGYCRPLYMFGTYETTGAGIAIPDDSATGASVDVVVYGLASVPEDIMLTLHIDHPRPQDLVVTLSSTNGSSDVLWNNDGSPDFYLPSFGIERDNEVNGRFTLHVVDTVAGETGVLNGFKMFVSSRWD